MTTRRPGNYDERLRRIHEAKLHRDSSFLIDALRDPDHRDTAAASLGELRATEASAPLIRLLDASDPQARAAAAIALGKIRVREAVPHLVAVAKDDPEIFVRTWAIGALGEIGDPTVGRTLAALLRDPIWKVRRSAATALGEIGDDSAVPALRDAMTRESLMRRRPYSRAISAISRTNSSNAFSRQ